MAEERGVFVLARDAVLKGEVRKCRKLHLYGYIEGAIRCGELVVHEGGRCFGTVRADTAVIAGFVQGELFIKNLINIQRTGDVAGNVQYGQLAMENGGTLSADLRNVPPSLAGDFSVSVRRGGSVPVTTTDLTALDPDDVPDNLLYRVSNVRNGYLAMMATPGNPVQGFTQSDLQAGRVLFVHNGGAAKIASFDAVVSDLAGATSGAPRTVTVDVIG